MAAPAQGGVVAFARRVADHRDSRAMIERMAKATLARVAHLDHAVLPTLFCDRCDTGMRAQGVIIAFAKSSPASAIMVAATSLPTPGMERRIATSLCLRRL